MDDIILSFLSWASSDYGVYMLSMWGIGGGTILIYLGVIIDDSYPQVGIDK